ncbi:MAG TPA: cupredoxin domain-containing protein, partial [Actinomycetota bacterium]
MTYRNRVLLLAAVGVLVTACGNRPGAERSGGQRGTGKEARVIEVRMVETAFEPAELTVSRGETVRFRFANAGAAVHEAFIGDVQDQGAHEEEMAAQMGHGGHSDDAERALTLGPG